MKLQEARVAPPPPPSLDAHRHAKLDAFLDLIQRWNPKINLVADASAEVVRNRHFDDAMQILPLLDPLPGSLADLGSGGGFPGLVLAIAEDRPVHLVESDRRKAAFLVEAAAHLGLRHVTVHPVRIEAARLPPIQILTARALAPLVDLLPHAARFLDADGVAIFPKGRTADAELTAAVRHWTFRAERFASRTDAEATILRLSEIQRAAP